MLVERALGRKLEIKIVIPLGKSLGQLTCSKRTISQDRDIVIKHLRRYLHFRCLFSNRLAPNQPG